MLRNALLVAIGLVSLPVLVSNVLGDPVPIVTYRVSGVISDPAGSDNPGLNGATVHFTFSLFDDTPESTPAVGVASYAGTGQLTIGGATVAASNGTFIDPYDASLLTVFDNRPISDPVDRIRFLFLGPPNVDSIRFFLFFPVTTWSSAAPPLTLPGISGLTKSTAQTEAGELIEDYSLQIREIEVVTGVPEPASFFLFGVGLAVLGLLKKRFS